MTPTMAAWLAWSGISTVAAVAVGIFAAAILPNIEAGIFAFGAGMAFSAMTPVILRRAGRWVR